MYRISFNQIVATVLLCLVIINVSCREDSDDIKSYAYADSLNFAEANSSLEGQFKAIWTAMNCNYLIWDYEEQQGLNWDFVYDDYLPRFKELDRKFNSQNPIPDSLVSELYDSIFTPLHDGHLYMYLKNIHTGKKIQKRILPQLKRVVENGADNIITILELFYLTNFKPTLEYYNDRGELEENIQEEDYIFALFKDDIAYLRVPEFNLTEKFKDRISDESNERIYKLWESWFDCIQNLQSTNSLKGIIIDVRNNLGGNANDYQYVLGALHDSDNKSGDPYHIIGYLREKSGIGRLDFSRLYPFTLPVYREKHFTIDAPIVVLVNSFSASMAEITCLSAKQLKNGYVIGTNTYGAFSPSADSSYAITYAGNVGDPSLANDEDKESYYAPFYIAIPSAAFLSLDKLFVDGTGIEPNEIIHLDYLEHSKSGKDNQLDRALEYIRTKKY